MIIRKYDFRIYIAYTGQNMLFGLLDVGMAGADPAWRRRSDGVTDHAAWRTADNLSVPSAVHKKHRADEIDISVLIILRLCL